MAVRSSTVVTGNGDFQFSPGIADGQYLLAASGNFDGATIEFYIDVFPATEAPLGISYMEAATSIVWLPRCQGYARVSGAGANTDVGLSVNELSSQHHRFN